MNLKKIIKIKIMKKLIKLLVTIEVPDNYVVNEPEWTLENAFIGGSEYHKETIVSVEEIDEN